MKTFFAVLLVLLVFTGLMAWVYLGGMGAARDTERLVSMRRVYGAWYMYCQDWNGGIPPNLYAVRNRLPDDRLLTSDRDPFAQLPGPYPIDPALWNSTDSSPIRIGYSYLGTFASHGKISVEWDQRLTDPQVGLLADPFAGSITITDATWEFSRSGRVNRVSVLGAASSVDKPGTTPSALFGKF